MNTIKLHCPNIFAFSEANRIVREESINFINNLENNFLKGSNLIIDLSKTIEAYADSTLVLFAQIHSMRYRNKYKKRPLSIDIIYPNKENNREGYAIFISTGLHTALEASNNEDIEALSNRRNFYQSGDVECLDTMILNNWDMISSEKINDEQKFLLHQGVSEAILNVRNHAYINKQALRNKIGRGRWWQCSWYQESQRTFVFLIYDMGCGILGSYPENTLSDKDRLKEAMTEGYTRYNNRKRGKGSENIKQVINRDVETEILTVYTNRLIYYYQYSNGITSDICIESQVPSSIRGTLIMWTLTLSKEKNNVN
ncbi:hypothetical protein ACLSY8_00050 [Avibacterium avium]|uniref:hypothetical protein n=1 Tax=Avibacterium avium TaxID=751 RepID=UPI003BF8AF71